MPTQAQAQEARENIEQSMQPPASHVGVKRQRDLGHRRHHDIDDGEDYCPRVYSDTEHSDDDVVQPSRRKRRGVNAATRVAGGTAPQQQTRPSSGDSLSREAQRSSQRPKRRHGRSLCNPPSSQGSASEKESETDEAPVAKFEEWPLGNAILKRVTMDGAPATFVVQFTWDPCANHGMGGHGTENRGTVSAAKRRRQARQRSNGSTKDEDKPTSTSKRARYTPADDAKICQLKEQGLSWIAIAKQFPGRSVGAIEVRYHTKLKTADPSRSGSRELCDHSRALSPVVGDDGGEEEFPVGEICGERKSDDGGLELLMKWKSGEETWEPYENMAETEALDEYERLDGRVGVATYCLRFCESYSLRPPLFV